MVSLNAIANAMAKREEFKMTVSNMSSFNLLSDDEGSPRWEEVNDIAREYAMEDDA